MFIKFKQNNNNKEIKMSDIGENEVINSEVEEVIEKPLLSMNG